MSKKKEPSVYTDRCWYVYNGIGDPFVATNYRRVSTKPQGRIGGHEILAIYTTLNGNNPKSPLSSNITQYIANALVSGLPQPPIYKPHHKSFVYLKDS